MKQLDEVKTFKGLGNGFGDWDTNIRVRHYSNDKLDLLILSNAPDNKGTDIADCIEYVATGLVADMNIDFARSIWIMEPEAKQYKLAIFNLQVQPNKLDPKKIIPIFKSPVFKNLKKSHVESIAQEPIF